MSNYKMTITNGRYNAPSMVVEATDESKAEKLARQLSGLGRFASWSFSAVEIKQKRK
jgi:hypothetical protein